MDTVEIGAFEAKTHFSQLLKQVEEGKVFHITRRGKPIAVLAKEGEFSKKNRENLVDRIAARRSEISRRENISIGEIFSFRDTGRR